MKKIEAYLNLKGFSVLKCVMSMKSVLFVVMLCLCSFTALGQYIIKGKVVGKDDGLPLPQVSVFIKGTQIGLPTDMNGEFTLTVPDKKIKISFRYPGYITQTQSPNFKQPMLIRLRPDCTHHHYFSTNFKIHAGLDLTNSALTGRITFPSFRLYKTITSAYEIYALGGQEVHKADAEIWHLIRNCDWELSLASSYRNYRISANGFNFNSLIIAPHIGFDKTTWILGLGRGIERQGDLNISSTGLQVGLIRECRIDLFGNLIFIPVSITATKWDSFWDIESSIDMFFLPIRLRISYNRIGSFNQFSIATGILIHP